MEIRFDLPIDEDENRCWLWGFKMPYGYRGVSFGEPVVLAHRLLYKLRYGYLPRGSCVLHHTCGNTECCNPEHLKIMDKQQHNFEHGGVKLTLADVREIREMKARGYVAREIRAHLGNKVGMTTIWRVIHGKSWAGVT